jgi:2-oxoglutarate ferredoxin oxidoreductase subunit alpha
MSDERILMRGNDAIAEGALRAGCAAYFGYPITPQNEIIAYMAKNMLGTERVFIQAESETAAVNMVYGAACAGARAMTSSSSPGVSLKQEGISYAAGADIPIVVVNVMRGGPGLGSIAPSQSDYFQATRGGGHGDYRCIVLAPKSVQECADLTYLAFDLADEYRMPAIILADGMIGQMMEAVTLPAKRELSTLPKRDWTAGNMKNRPARHITSIFLVPQVLDERNAARFERYRELAARETRFETLGGADAELVLVAYGTAARISQGARQLAEKEGIKLAVFRPVTLFPFPHAELAAFADGKPVLTVEMSCGQLVEDVKLAFYGSKTPSEVHLLAHSGGVIPTEEEVFAKVKSILAPMTLKREKDG